MVDEELEEFCCVAYYIHHSDDILAALQPCFKNVNFTKQDFFKFLKIHILNDTPRYQASQCLLPQQCNEELTTPFIVYIIVWSLVLVTILLSNTLVIMAMRKINFSVTNLFICSLSISDMLVGLFIIPIKIAFAAYKLKFCMSEFVCRFYISGDNIFFTASITNLFMICIDRYVALNYPYKYPNWMTKRKSKYLVGAVWIYGLFWGLMANIKWDDVSEPAIHISNLTCQNNRNYIYVTAILVIVFFFPVISMGIMYGRILFIARSQAKGISRDSFMPHHNNNEMDCLSPKSDHNGNIDADKQRRSLRRSRSLHYRKMIFKACKTVAIVYGTFVVCWLPVSCLSLVISYSSHLAFKTSNAYIVFVEILPVLNSTLNPFIYVLSNRQYRAAFKKVLTFLHIWKKQNTFTRRPLMHLNSDTLSTGF